MIDLNTWLIEAKSDSNADKCGMYLVHNGVVRSTAKKEVRENIASPKVKALEFSYDEKLLNNAINKAQTMKGIYTIKVKLNNGKLNVGDDLMYILVGGDIRNNVVACLEALLKDIKENVVTEKEIYE